MVGVSERAKEVLLQTKRSVNIPQPDVGLRLALDAGGTWSLFADRARLDDQVVEHRGSTVLLIDGELSAALGGTAVDCRRTPDGGVELVLADGPHPGYEVYDEDGNIKPAA
jgi:hypothetical protein